MAASALYKATTKEQIVYFDRTKWDSVAEFRAALSASTTLYVGNLGFATTEEQLFELFRRCGDVRRVIVGLNRTTLTPCGFCFVEYFLRDDAEAAVACLNGARVDGRSIRVDWDPGFTDGRQYGRGKSGGQVRDEWSTNRIPQPQQREYKRERERPPMPPHRYGDQRVAEDEGDNGQPEAKHGRRSFGGFDGRTQQ